jgi:hypothetical protein
MEMINRLKWKNALEMCYILSPTLSTFKWLLCLPRRKAVLKRDPQLERRRIKFTLSQLGIKEV